MVADKLPTLLATPEAIRDCACRKAYPTRPWCIPIFTRYYQLSNPRGHQTLVFCHPERWIWSCTDLKFIWWDLRMSCRIAVFVIEVDPQLYAFRENNVHLGTTRPGWVHVFKSLNCLSHFLDWTGGCLRQDCEKNEVQVSCTYLDPVSSACWHPVCSELILFGNACWVLPLYCAKQNQGSINTNVY